MWFLYPQLARLKSRIRPVQRLRSIRVDYTISRQRKELHIVTRERWTEAELEALPAEEPDVFERKAGKLFDEKGEFLDTVAKALSAFANSGGGSLIIGVENDGTPDGLPPLFGALLLAIGSSKRYLTCSITRCPIFAFIPSLRAIPRAFQLAAT
jgi:Putative DNA-binding domain